MTDTEYRHLRACYAAACSSLHGARQGTAQHRVAYESANRLWDDLATEVSRRNIVALFRARKQVTRR